MVVSVRNFLLVGGAAAFVVYLVMARQDKQSTEVSVQQVSMDKEVAEFNRDFEKKAFRPMTSVIKREERKIQSTDAKLKKLEEKQTQLQKKSDNTMDDFDKQIDRFDKELGPGK